MLTPFPASWAHHPTKPGAARLPFFGVEPALLDSEGNTLQGPSEGLLVLKVGVDRARCGQVTGQRDERMGRDERMEAQDTHVLCFLRPPCPLP
jgi:hypothetical protein